jgi:signal transduction histidine kinase
LIDEPPADLSASSLDDAAADAAVLEHAILANLSEGVTVVRPEDMTIMFANPAIEDMLGWQPGELVGQPVTVMHVSRGGRSARRTTEMIADAVRADGSWVGVVATATKDAHTVYLAINVREFDAPGLGSAWLTVHTNISAARSARNRSASLVNDLARASEWKDEVLSIVAHELRAPLASVSGFADLLGRGADPASDAEFVEAIRRNARRMVRSIDDMLAAAGLDSHNLSVVVETVRLSDAIRGASLDSGVRDLIVECPPDVEVSADPERLGQILVNLLTNAVKYGSPPCTARVVEADDGMVEVHVIDCGEGVPADFVGSLFDRYARDPAQRGQHRPGIGLGLAIARDLARAQGGDISYRPSDAGGAEFILTLRAAGPHGADGPAGEDSPPT